ncbi:MAG: hypothetical protein HYS81_01920 [Candidatus Aenigmatarchaeota archaeon]|nr:MAG: hypothetical protein HYS81_01920 [Candidatus Aenigmarchaeota archaeon]
MVRDSLEFFDADGEFLKRIESVKSIGPTPRKVILFIQDSEMPFLKLIKQWIPARYEGTICKTEEFDRFDVAELTIKNRDLEGALYKCSHCGQEIPKEELFEYGQNMQNLLVFPKNSPVFFLVTNKGSHELDADLGFFKALYPFVSRVRFRSYQLKQMLDVLPNKTDIVISEYVAKRYYGEKKTIELHQKVDVDTAFLQAAKENTWIDSILLEVDGKKIRLARNGRIQYYQSYHFSNIFSQLIKPILHNLTANYENVLRNRSRTIANPAAKPIVFKTEKPVFTSQNAGIELIKRLGRLRGIEIAQVNSDDQMPELMVKDYTSGASYSIDVVAENMIVMTPQTGVREISLNRVVNKILEDFDCEVI